MFDSIGRKIKTLAKVLCWLGIIGSVIAALVMINSRYSETRITGLITLFAGPLVSWISSFTLYALGEITENSATQAWLLRKWAEKEGVVEEERIAEKQTGTGIEKSGGYEENVWLLKCYDEYYNDQVCRLLQKNKITLRTSFWRFTIYVRPADFQRARALIVENFKDNPKVMKGLAPETPSDN